MSPTPSRTVLKDTLSALARNKVGFSTSEVSGFTSNQVAPAANALVAAGKLHRAKLSAKVVRYFSTEALAKAYVTGHVKHAAATTSSTPRTRATWPKDAPMNITANTKITIAPPPPSGYFRTNTHSK